MRGLFIIVFTSVLALVVLGPAAAAGTPLEADHEEGAALGWTQLLPPAPLGDPAEMERRCGVDGTSCLRHVERQLAQLVERLGCDHRAVFAATYQLLTRELRRTVERDPAAFDDPAGIGVLAEVFHAMYLRALEDHAAGRAVPPAWEVALDAAAEADHSAGQDMLLAVNAHVQRDMPFALAEVKLRAPDGTSRKADHDRVNQVLHRAYDRIESEVAARYDPHFGKGTGHPAHADRTAFTKLLAAWREGAWRNAERLTSATDPDHRQIVITTIEANAHVWAESFARPEAPGYRKLRAAHCREYRRR